TQFNRGKVVRLELERDQASFRVLQREFLSSGDRDFHPTDLAEDADGSLLVVDTGGWFYRGCPTSQLAKPEIEGAIYRITSQELTPLPDPRGLRIDWENLSDAELLALLNDTRFPVREQAIRKIAQRGEKMLPLLASAVSKSDIRVRQNALWAVCQIQGAHSLDKPDAAPQVVITGLQDDRFEIALTACRIASTYPHSNYRAALEKLLASEQDSLRREAATALGRLQNAETIPALIEALKRNGISREEEHALIYALIETNAPTELSGFLKSDSSAVSRGVLIAIDQVQTELLDEAVLLKLLDRSDPALTMTCLEVYLRHTQWNAILTEYLPGVLTHLDEYTSSQREALSRLLSTRLSLPAAQSLVDTHLQKSTAPESVRLLLFKAIAAADATPVSANWRAAVNSALLDANSELAAIALRIVQRDDAAQYRESLEQIAQSVEQPLSSRVAAQQLLAGKSRALADPSFAILQEALRSQRSQQALAASQVLAGSSLSTEQILKLAPQLQTVSSDSLSLIIPLFARTREPQVLDAFLNEIGKSTQLESLSASTFSDVIKGFPDSHRDQANVLLRRIERAEQQKVARIDQILPQLEGADPVRGEALFHSEKAKCGSCHLIKNKGHRIGPELTTIGANRSAHDLIESVLFPSASIVRDYETYTVIMSSGKTISGLLIRETTEAVWIQPAVGVAISIPHEEVEEMAPSTTSMMPGGLEKTMTDQELADIISFLKQLQ
ncbi:MAG: HEAT repeat domain-containing protein, partial [Planctomycetaceae bacterium]|nr:HEAT repeat domain-containing protein [Planctomycetaceae bacterium]